MREASCGRRLATSRRSSSAQGSRPGWPSPSTLLSGCQMVNGPAVRRQQIGPAEGLLLLTDGVVERRGADIAEGLEQLRTFVVEHASRGTQFLANSVVSEFCSAPQDDCCIVVLRRV